MGLLNRKKEKIQATEGVKQDVTIEDGITWARMTTGIQGITNQYLSYGTQVDETYRKYRGKSDWGCAPVRTIIDTRTSFIAGEGLAIASKDEVFTTWVKKFLKASRLSGSQFFDAVLGAELAGRILFVLSPVIGSLPILTRYPYNKASTYKIVDGSLVFEKGGNKTVIAPDRFTHIRPSGDDCQFDEAPTRTGLVLTDCENYDRALKDIRRTNYVAARITPAFHTESNEETESLRQNLARTGWRIGQAFIGTATLSFIQATIATLDNLKGELASIAKNISAVTGVPVHWLGHTDLMSNRATAEDLYQMISNATSRDRTMVAEGIYELIVKAQAMYIDSGGTEISAVQDDFTVTIPSIDYGRFESMIKALSVAYMDTAISIDDYRSFIPGIDPLVTKKAVEAEQAKKPKAPEFPGLDLLGGQE